MLQSVATSLRPSLRSFSTKISSVHAREIIDSRGNPTVEVDVVSGGNLFRASVPSGASTGIYEAVELRDGGKRYAGKGVLNAVNNVNTTIAQALIGADPSEQTKIDNIMIELDGTPNKGNLGANAILGASLAVAKAGAAAKNVPLYQHFADLAGNTEFVLPVPALNVINGGSHAGNKLAMQEFMLLPTGASSFTEAMIMGCEVYHKLKSVIKSKYGQDATNVGDEGGFAPNIQSNLEALDLLVEAIEQAGYTGAVEIGMDVAASEFFKNGQYDLNFKTEGQPDLKSAAEMIEIYQGMARDFPVVSIEDPFDQDDWAGYTQLVAATNGAVQVVGDDLLVTNPKKNPGGNREESLQCPSSEGEPDRICHGVYQGCHRFSGCWLGRHGLAPQW